MVLGYREREVLRGLSRLDELKGVNLQTVCPQGGRLHRFHLEPVMNGTASLSNHVQPK